MLEVFTISGLLFGGLIQLIVDPPVIWFVANFMLNLGDKIPLKKCIVCTIMMTVVFYFSIAMLKIPIPLLNYAVAVVVWYKGTIAAIEGSLESIKGGFSILFIHTVIAVGLCLGLSQVPV